MLQITTSSLITNLYSDQIMKYVGYIEIAIGFGIGIGPMLGSLFYEQLGFKGTMYMFGFINVGALAVCVVLLPSSLD